MAQAEEQRPPKVLVFDVGNVLVHWDPRHLYRRIFADEARMEWFLANVCDKEWNVEQDRGRSWAEAVIERTARHPEWEAEIRAFDERWHEMIPGEIAANVALLRELKAAGWPLYSVTNFSREKFSECEKRFSFLKLFDGIVVSAHERLIKPQAGIFRLLLDRYGLEAADCLFIDDSAVNCEGARAVGLRTVHAPPHVDLKAALKAHGVTGG